jgi:hypothetical protein
MGGMSDDTRENVGLHCRLKVESVHGPRSYCAQWARAPSRCESHMRVGVFSTCHYSATSPRVQSIILYLFHSFVNNFRYSPIQFISCSDLYHLSTLYIYVISGAATCARCPGAPCSWSIAPARCGSYWLGSAWSAQSHSAWRRPSCTRSAHQSARAWWR